MGFDCSLIECINLSNFDLETLRSYPLSDSVEGVPSPTSKKDSCTFTRKGSRKSAANCTSGSVDNGIFLLKQHNNSPHVS
jgi:hypothetical protein